MAGMAAIPATLIRHRQMVPRLPENFCFPDALKVISALTRNIDHYVDCLVSVPRDYWIKLGIYVPRIIRAWSHY